MRILLVNKYFHPAGGPETLLFDSMESLQALGHTVIPFSMQHPKNSKSQYEKYFVSNVDYNQHSNSLWSLAKTTSKIIFNLEAKEKIEQLIADTKPDIAHLHNIYHQISPSILLPLKKHKIPVVMTLHDFKLVCPNYTFLRDGQTCEECEGKHFYKAIKYRCVKNSYVKSLVCAMEMYLHRFFKIYLDSVDSFMVLSRFSQQRFVQYGIPQHKMVFLPAPVDTERLKPQRVSKKDYILFFGRLVERNGISTLVGAMKHIPEVRLKIAGDGELKDFLENYISQEKIENTSLLGFLSREDLKREISNSSFTVFPNHCYHLCPSSILESFAYAKPVIGSNLGSVPELIEDGKTGLLFEPKNEKELAQKINYLCENPKVVNQMGRNARRKVEENYSAEKYYPKLLGIYQHLIEKKKVRGNVRRQVDIKTFNSSPDKELHVIAVQTGIHSVSGMDSRRSLSRNVRGGNDKQKSRTDTEKSYVEGFVRSACPVSSCSTLTARGDLTGTQEILRLMPQNDINDVSCHSEGSEESEDKTQIGSPAKGRNRNDSGRVSKDIRVH